MKDTKHYRKRIMNAGIFLWMLMLAHPATYAQVSVGVTISAGIAPPALPVYTQPPCPADGYLWTPGYWAYDDVDGYYWVPGVWVRPPMVGYLWTPSYWGYAGGVYGWHPGYWGPHIGFYGGVNYGYGYGGSGFGGGRWEGGAFRYNTAVMNVNTTVVHNTYIDRTVVVNNTTVVNNRTSFNGGPGGISARPTAQEEAAVRERHVAPTQEQSTHQQTASHDRNQFAAVNNGRPAAAAMNTVNGHRFDPQGHAAPPVVARASQPIHPAAGGQHATAAAGGQHATATAGGQHATAGGQHPNTGIPPHPASAGQGHPVSANQPHPVSANQSHPTSQHPMPQHAVTSSHPMQPHPVQQQPHSMPQQHMAPQHAQARPQPQHANPHGGGGAPHEHHR